MHPQWETLAFPLRFSPQVHQHAVISLPSSIYTKVFPPAQHKPSAGLSLGVMPLQPGHRGTISGEQTLAKINLPIFLFIVGESKAR